MTKRIFISFLGTGFYEKTNYIDPDFSDEIIEETRFVQIATLKRFCSGFTENDKAYIFTTEKALKNWEDNEHYNFKIKETVFYEGLKNNLKAIKLKCPFENVMIKDGSSTEEIWDIFKTVFDKIEQNAEITFDITHGFRTLPMFNMVLINYAKLLKNISVKGIYYGAFEAKTKNVKGQEFSPIWNLLDFEILQEWTNSAQLFLKAGDGENLSTLMRERTIMGGEEIRNFSEEILANRGVALTEGISAVAIKNVLKKSENSNIHPVVKPIFELVEKEFINYEKDNVLNGLHAVKWCIDHNLIQQGYTLMSEFLPTYILNYISEEVDNRDSRNTINGLLGINGKKDKFRYDEKIKGKQIEIIDKALTIPYFKKLCKRNRSINPQNRDDINHGGFRKNPKSYSTFKEELKDKYEKLKNVIIMIENKPCS